MKLSELSTLLTKDLTSSSLALSATGSSFSAWGKEEEDGHLGKKLSSTGESCSALALSTGVFAQRQMEGVEDPLSEILAYIASALLAFQRREAVRLEAEACAREVASFDASACASDSTFSTLPPTSSSPSSMSWLKKTPAVEGAATSSGESAGSKKNKELYAVALLKQGKVKERLEKVSTTLLSEYESFERTRLSLMKNILIHASRIQREHFLTLEESSKTFVNNVC